MAESRKNSVFKVIFWTGVILTAVMAGFVGLFWKTLPPQIPWLYSFPWGETQLISKIWLVAIFLGMEVVLVMTRFVAVWAGKEDDTVQNTVMIGAVAAVVLMAASFFRVMAIFLKA